MQCPRCGANNDRVTDSRTSVDACIIRRRRECLICGARFTTYERIERHMPRVIKRDGRREAFERAKIERGLQSACQKRPIPSEALNQLIDSVSAELERTTEAEVQSERIGQMVMERLAKLDTVAYVRFASVYSAFDDVRQFIDAVKDVGVATAPQSPRSPRHKPKKT